MTSNLGARQLQDFGTGVGFGTSSRVNQEESEKKSVIENALKRAFAPEFLNRVDDLIVFNALKKEDIHHIIDIELEKLFKRVTDLGYNIKLTESAKDYIAEKGFDEKFGARPLKRALQKYLEDPLAEQIIDSGFKTGDTLMVDYNKESDKIEMKTEKSKEVKSKKEPKGNSEEKTDPETT
jgi:ATP-dependent Clp protease ATP-binding subunit ClpC